MPKKGDEIFNPRTGQRMIFLETGNETNGKLLRIESFNPGPSPAEPEHLHPFQESSCEVLSGKLKFMVNGEVKEVSAGEIINIPPDVPHYFWNETDTEAHTIQEFKPALTIADFFDFYFALNREGKVNKNGMPSVLRMMVALKEYDQDIRVTHPPRALQLISMNVLAPVGKILGYRAKI